MLLHALAKVLFFQLCQLVDVNAVELKNSDIRILDQAFQSDPGYVLNFSDRTFRDYFEDEFDLDIYHRKYEVNGTSKMNRLRTFCRIEQPALVSRVLRSLWEYREASSPTAIDELPTKTKLFELLARIEGVSSLARTDAIDRFVKDETLDEIVSSIERDMQADRPVVALDRLHTYCMKKFSHLLEKRGVECTSAEPLNSRVGKYVKLLQAEFILRDMTQQIIKSSIGIFEKFNHVRNNESLAHDNEILDKREARFIFDSVSAFLRLVNSIDVQNFEN